GGVDALTVLIRDDVGQADVPARDPDARVLRSGIAAALGLDRRDDPLVAVARGGHVVSDEPRSVDAVVRVAGSGHQVRLDLVRADAVARVLRGRDALPPELADHDPVASPGHGHVLGGELEDVDPARRPVARPDGEVPRTEPPALLVAVLRQVDDPLRA